MTNKTNNKIIEGKGFFASLPYSGYHSQFDFEKTVRPFQEELKQRTANTQQISKKNIEVQEFLEEARESVRQFTHMLKMDRKKYKTEPHRKLWRKGLVESLKDSKKEVKAWGKILKNYGKTR